MNSPRDIAVSEIIGAIMLVTIVVVIASVVGVMVLSQPAPQKIPSLSAVISNQSQMVYIKHDGGDPLVAGQYKILIDGTDVTSSVAKTGTPGSWVIGDVISYQKPGTNPPGSVQVVYTGYGSSAIVLASSIFGTGAGGIPTVSPTSNTTTTTTTVTGTTTQVPPSVVTAGFTGSPTSGGAPLIVSFTDASTGPVISWAWLFGDGGSSNLQNPSHQYNNTGSYTVSLMVSNGSGTSTLARTSYVTVTTAAPVVIAGFTGTPLTGTMPLTVQFTDASTGSPLSRTWNFGDTGTSTATSPSHQYISAGTYTVSLIVSNGTGTNTLTRTGYVVVKPPVPVADFTANPVYGAMPLTVQFADASSNVPSSWAWTFGDGGSSTLQNPSHAYASAGTYSVSLNATNAGGSNTVTKTGYILVTNPVSGGGTVYLNSNKAAYVEAGGALQFHVTDLYSIITVNGVDYPLNQGDTVNLVMGSNEYGSFYATSSKISTFTFSDVSLYQNGVFKNRGATSKMYVSGYDQMSSTMNLNVPVASAWTDFEVNGVPVFTVGPSSARIYLTGLYGTTNLNAQPNVVYYTGGASGYLVI